MERFVRQFTRLNWTLILILLIGAGLRLWAINFGLPYMYHPDEGVPVGIALRILRTGNWNPEFFNWPSLSIYLNTLVYLGYYGVGRVFGWFASPSDLPFPDVEIMAVGKAGLPEEFLLGRGLTVLFGTLSILLVYLVCRRFTSNQLAANLSGVLFAVEIVSVENSHFIRPDTIAVFFALLSCLFALRIVTDPRLTNYVFAAITLGLATSGKYNLALVAIPLFVAHLIQFRSRFLFRREIYLSVLVAAAAFFLTTPFAILDVSQFLKAGPAEDAAIYSTGHPGAEGNSLQWYLSFLWSTQSWLLVLAFCETLLLLAKRDSKGLVLLSFPLVYFIFINLYTVHSDRTVLPVLPFVAILAASFVARFFLYLARWTGKNRVWLALIFGSLLIVLLVPPFLASAALDLRLSQPDGRDEARAWLDANLPSGSRVALESYSPYVDRKEFLVQGFYGLQEHTSDWYISNGYEYLVFSQGMFGRYFADPSRYATEVSHYNSLFAKLIPIANFDENNFEIRIYKTDVVLPARRVAARFGNEGELIELVGYDDATQKWMPGQPLQVKLTWRAIEQKIEPFEVGLRLLDKNDREVGSMRGDLFQGKGWQEGMFSTDWTIPVQENTVPGEYRLEVNVIESQFAYQTPGQTWAGDTLDRVAIDPIKMSVLPPTTIELQNMRQAGVRFGNSIGLLGYLTTTNARAGASLPLTLYWQSLAKPSRDYTVFVHLVDANGKVVAQVDAQPRGGAYSTSLWDASEIIRDDYALPLPADLAPGSYRIEIGLYEYPSLTRLAIADAQGNSSGDHWVLPDAVQVVQ